MDLSRYITLLLVLWTGFIAHLLYMRRQHSRALARSRERVLGGDRSIVLKLTWWGMLKEVPNTSEDDSSV